MYVPSKDEIGRMTAEQRADLRGWLATERRDAEQRRMDAAGRVREAKAEYDKAEATRSGAEDRVRNIDRAIGALAEVEKAAAQAPAN